MIDRCLAFVGAVCTGLLALCLLLPADCLAAPDSTATVEEFLVKDLKVIFKRNTANETISAQLYFKGGVLNQTEAHAGIEPLIFSSAVLKDKKYTEKSWEKILQGAGAQLRTLYERDFTMVALRCARQYFDELWEVYTDYLRDTKFYDQQVDLARERIQTQIQRRREAPDAHLRDLAERMFYANHPSGRNPLGTKDSIGKISIPEMQKYMKEHFVKSRALLVVVGNWDKADLLKKVKKTLAKLPKGKKMRLHASPVTHAAPACKIEEREVATNYILGLFSAPGLAHPDYYPMSVAIDMLNGRLFGEIRTKRNLSYAPYAFLASNKANYGGVYATSNNPDSTVNTMLVEMKRLQTEPIAMQDLQNRVTMYLTQYYLNNETNESQGQFLARFELAGRGWREGEKIVERLRSVTPEQVQRVAQRYFKNVQFVYLGNPNAIDKTLLTSM